MVISFISNTMSFIRKFLLLICISSSRSSIEDSTCAYNRLVIDGTIILRELNEVSDSISNIKEFLKEACSRNFYAVGFELYPNFSLNPEYFDDILEKRYLLIYIHFDSELKDLVRKNKVESSEYVNKFLENFLSKQNLKILNLSCLNLTEIPKIIYKFKNLRELKLGCNDLDNINLEFNNLTKLRSLEISGCKKIEKIDDSVFNLQSLKSLLISDCSITEIPEGIDRLENLSYLDASKNPLKSLPKNFSNLKELSYLNISESALQELVIDISEHPKLSMVYLCNNYSLKSLKLLFLKSSTKFIYFETINCPLEDVEIWINMNNAKLNAFYHSNQELQNFYYVFKLNPKELFSFTKNTVMSKSKIYEFKLIPGPGSNKTILIKEFNFERRNTISEDNLIAKWTKICEKFYFKFEKALLSDYNHSVEFLKNLYKVESGFYSDWNYYFPFEYKEKMISVLYDLFDELDESNLEAKVMIMLKMFRRPCSEQFVYFNYLLKYSKRILQREKCFAEFLNNSIEILRDYTFIIFLNLRRYGFANRLRRSVRFSKVNNEDLKIRGGSDGILEILYEVIDAKTNFDSKFTFDYILEIISIVVYQIDDPVFFENKKMVEFILVNCEVRHEYFEYETIANVIIIKKLSNHGIKFVITLMLDGLIPMHC